MSDDEQVIVDDILNTLDEGVFENMIEKIKTYSELENCNKSHFKYITSEDYLDVHLNETSLCIPKD